MVINFSVDRTVVDFFGTDSPVKSTISIVPWSLTFASDPFSGVPVKPIFYGRYRRRKEPVHSIVALFESQTDITKAKLKARLGRNF